MGDLVTGWFEDDGAISHAVDADDPEASLCDKPGPTLYEPIVAWQLAPAPRCQRCEQAIELR
jgi:hypothetical protein